MTFGRRMLVSATPDTSYVSLAVEYAAEIVRGKLLNPSAKIIPSGKERWEPKGADGRLLKSSLWSGEARIWSWRSFSGGGRAMLPFTAHSHGGPEHAGTREIHSHPSAEIWWRCARSATSRSSAHFFSRMGGLSGLIHRRCCAVRLSSLSLESTGCSARCRCYSNPAECLRQFSRRCMSESRGRAD